MENTVKAQLKKNVRTSYLIKIAVVGTVSVAGLSLGIFSLAAGNVFFAFWYFVAFVFGLSYTVIRINTAFPTYVATDGDILVLSTWANGVAPYRISGKINFFSDFIPEKVNRKEIAVNDISELFIGTKRFLKRSLKEENYPTLFNELERDGRYKDVLKRADFLYVLAKNGEYCFMPVTDFDTEEIADIIDLIEKNCMGVQMHINIPKLVRLREKGM